MRIIDLRRWVLDEIEQASDSVQESQRVSSNSYGHGYNVGWQQALERVLLKVDDKLDT